MITWNERVDDLRKRLGQEPTLDELLQEARQHEMTPEEIQIQQESWVRGMTTPCEHGVLDFEQCAECRK